LLAEIPLLIPVVAADGEGALTIVIIGGMLRMRRRSSARRLHHDHRQVSIVIMVALVPASFCRIRRKLCLATGRRHLRLGDHQDCLSIAVAVQIVSKDRQCRSAKIGYHSI
jgi:hypothetical protein